jgi:3-hydroxyisobutyrate dehydrogenase-like beta-hydroxyacid dehydrogenase
MSNHGNLGFVGLGVMGGRIAKRLLDAGHAVTGYNRTRAKAAWLEAAGLKLVATPREVAEAAGVTFVMVSDTAALDAVTRGPDGLLAGLGDGKVLCDMSTVSPLASRALARDVAATGARMLDTPVSGSVSTLEAGKLSIMVGGEPEVLERVRPLLADIGPTVIHIGANGQAALLKTAINLSLPVQLTALSEGLLIAEKGGVPKQVALEAMLASVIASPSLAYRGPFLVELPEEAWFDVNMMQKDLQLALEMGRALDVPMPTTAATNELLTACRALGFGGQDFAAVYHTLARLAGVGPPGLHRPGSGGPAEPPGAAPAG